ncbi:MAG: methyl-accepting chemotaxis protein [Pseudomonas sp.]|nr:methyl-accepting chemotaxis protein [Pseudomonas sp.]
MKISNKVGLVAALVLIISSGLLSLLQISQVRETLRDQAQASIAESSQALARQIENWLNGKLQLIDLAAQQIDRNFSDEQIQQLFADPVLGGQFLSMFGGLEATGGQAITNDPTWQPAADWDARQRPWYSQAKAASHAVLTEPYAVASSGDILISAVTRFSDRGQFKGAFGGDISLKSIAESINTFNFNGAGYAFLLAGSGQIISHPNGALNGKTLAELFAGQTPALVPTLSEVEADGQHLLVSFIPLSNLDGMSWYIGVVLDERTVMAEANALTWRAAAGTVIGVILTLLVLGVLMRRLLRPLLQLRTSLREINGGQGDLTRRLPIQGNDEIAQVGEEFNRFLQSLQGLIGDVMSSSQQVRASSSETSSEASQAASRLQQQLQELDQLATAMQEMASTAEDVACNAQAAAQAASAASEATESGVSLVSQSSAAIMRLAADMDDTSQAVNELARLSDNIESILAVITSIAEQTNLLALNAAIEAARAGESGRGFAVVADEVRSLASRTQHSTQEIRQMIDQLQNGVKQVESRMQHNRDSASQSADEASAANEMLARIRESISRINDMNLQIATAAEQQSATSEEINRNTTNIRDISHAVAGGAEQQVRQCAAMVEQVGQQDRLLGRFKV